MMRVVIEWRDGDTALIGIDGTSNAAEVQACAELAAAVAAVLAQHDCMRAAVAHTNALLLEQLRLPGARL